MKSYQLKVRPQEGESTLSNNTQRLFVEIIDNEQKILIAAKAPHPDIKTIRTVIEAKEGTEVSLWIKDFNTSPPEGPFDLVIYHQLPDANTLPGEVDLMMSNVNSLFITGTKSLDQVNDRNPVISYVNEGQTDEVNASLSEQFDLFDIKSDVIERFDEYPPISVPYGNFQLKNDAQVMLYQKIGNTNTNRPLISIWTDGERKSAVVSGQSIWKWRLQESAIYEKPELFDEIFGKLIQYLSTTDDKSNFTVKTVEQNFSDTEAIEFSTEVYNELYKRVYDCRHSLL